MKTGRSTDWPFLQREKSQAARLFERAPGRSSQSRLIDDKGLDQSGQARYSLLEKRWPDAVRLLIKVVPRKHPFVLMDERDLFLKEEKSKWSRPKIYLRPMTPKK